MTRTRFLTVLLTMLIIAGGLVRAQESGATLEDRIKLLEAQIAAQKAALDEMKKEMQDQQKEAADKAIEAQKNAIETADKEISKEEKKLNLTGWKFGGDVRLRYDGQMFDDSTVDRNRMRYRLRFNVSKNIGYGVTGYFQLASGETAQGNSANQTETASFDKKTVWIDQAYLTWTPDITGHFLTFGGGKTANPYVNTPMVWDPDINPEGFYETVRHTFGVVEPYFTFGQMIINENAAAKDAYTLAYQGGVNLKSGKLKGSINVAYYDWVRYNTNYKYDGYNTIATINPGGVKVLDAGDFHILDVLGKIGYDFKYPVAFFVDYAENTAAKGPYADQDTAWSVGGTLGQNKHQKDFSLAYRYAHIDANAVVGTMADDDFGYANRKGSEFKFRYNIYDPLTIGMNFYWTSKVLYTIPGAPDQKRIFIDLQYTF